MSRFTYTTARRITGFPKTVNVGTTLTQLFALADFTRYRLVRFVWEVGPGATVTVYLNTSSFGVYEETDETPADVPALSEDSREVGPEQTRQQFSSYAQGASGTTQVRVDAFGIPR